MAIRSYCLEMVADALFALHDRNNCLDSVITTVIDINVKTPEDIGEIIRRVRRNQGIRQDDLAAYIDSSHVFMRDAERGKPSVQLGRVLRALDELGIKMTLQVPDAFMQPKSKRSDK